MRLDAAQLRLCAEIVPGRDFRDVHLSAHRILGDVLLEIGVTKLPGQAALGAGCDRRVFPARHRSLAGPRRSTMSAA